MLAGVLVLAGLAAGCARPGSAGPETTAPEPAGESLAVRLLDRSFETTGAGDVTGYDLVPDSALTLSFYRDHEGAEAFGGDAGCNSMGGRATWDGDTVRAAEGLVQTEMGCEGLMDQESWWAGLLTAGIALTLDGDTLTVTAEGPVRITMTDSSVVHPDLPLAGTTWHLDGIVQGTGDDGSVSSVPGDLPVTMTISREDDGRLRLDVFNGLKWLSAPGGRDGTTGKPAGEVRIEPVDATVDPMLATAGVVRVSSGLEGNAEGCEGGGTDCFVDMSVLGSDFDFHIKAGNLTVDGLGENAGHGFIFRAES